jgi:hypothetical protein
VVEHYLDTVGVVGSIPIAPTDEPSVTRGFFVLWEEAHEPMLNVVILQAQSLKNPTRSVPELLETLQQCGLVQSVARLRELLG